MNSLLPFEKYREGSMKDYKFYRLYYYQDLTGLPLSTEMRSEFDFDSEYRPWDSTIEGWETAKLFNIGYEADILDKIGNNKALLALMKKIYLNGVYKISLDFERLHKDVLTLKFQNDTAKALEDTVYIDLHNRVHGHQTLSSRLKSFFERSTGIELPSVEQDSYNISGIYFNTWEFKKSNNPPCSDESKTLYKYPRGYAKLRAVHHAIAVDLKLLSEFEMNDNDKWRKGEIELYATKNYSLNNGQAFYTAYKEIRERSLDGYIALLTVKDKRKILELSDGDERFRRKLKLPLNKI